MNSNLQSRRGQLSSTSQLEKKSIDNHEMDEDYGQDEQEVSDYGEDKDNQSDDSAPDFHQIKNLAIPTEGEDEQHSEDESDV